MIRTASALMLVSLALPRAASAQNPDDVPLLVVASRIVVASDTVLENQALLIRDGKVALVGKEIPAEARRGARVLQLKGTVVPGFVDPHTYLAQATDLAEPISPITPELEASQAFDPFDPALLRWARHGVTTVGLAPLSTNTFAGQAAVVRTGKVGAVLGKAYLKLALVEESLNQHRMPTSRMGAADLIRASFAAARAATGGDSAKARVLRDVLAGAVPLAIHARTHAGITAALDLCQELGVTPLLLGADEARLSMSRLAAMGGSVMLEPLTLRDKLERLRLPAALEAAGVPFSFTADGKTSAGGASPGFQPPPGLPPGIVLPPGLGGSRSTPTERAAANPESLRLCAALAIRYGASRRAALAALTRVPATQCGVESRCGALRQGCDADFAVYSGDPLDLGSRLEAVFIGGRRLAPAQAKEVNDGDLR